MCDLPVLRLFQMRLAASPEPAFVLLPAVTIAGSVDSMGIEVMSLESVLVFGLAFVTNIVVLLAMHRPETRVVFKH